MTRLDPASASAAARKLTGVGNALDTAWAEVKAEIMRINGTTPWGKDEAGEGFDKNYSKGNSPDSPALKALELGDQMVAKMKELGPLVQEAIKGTVSSDEFTAKLFKDAGGKKA
jgi:hypothetical protein